VTRVSHEFKSELSQAESLSVCQVTSLITRLDTDSELLFTNLCLGLRYTPRRVDTIMSTANEIETAWSVGR